MDEHELELLIPLGETTQHFIEIERSQKTIDVSEQLHIFEEKLMQLATSVDSIYHIIKNIQKKLDMEEPIKEVCNEKKSIPENTTLIGVTRNVPFYCTVKDGGFYVGITRYNSLSAAAEGVSGVRRNGRTFWKLRDGKSVAEVYK